MDNNHLVLAAVRGDLESIKSLIRDGVDINCPNKYGSTCLTTACHYDNDEIVSYLIQSGVDLDQQRNDEVDTAIHRCVERKSFKCLKLLLDNGARLDVRTNGLTPFLAACNKKRAPVMEYLFETSSCTRSAKIEALEFMGAKCVKEGDFESASGYWSRSLEERAKAEPGDLLHPKSADRHPVFGNSSEFDTLEELNTIASSEEEMWMQSLIIMERILGSNNLDIYYGFVEQACWYLGDNDYVKCLPLWMDMLDLQLKLLSGSLHRTTFDTLLSLFDLVSVMAREDPCPPCKDVMSVLNKAVHASEPIMKHHVVKDHPSNDHMEKVILLALNSIEALIKCQPNMSEIDKINFHEVVKEFLHLNPRDVYDFTPLHCACQFDDFFTLPPDVVKLLLEAGADPGAVQCTGRTPLHVACVNKKSSFSTLEVVELLLKAGASPGAVDGDGNTPLHLVSMNNHPNKHDVIQLLLFNCCPCEINVCNAEGKSFSNYLPNEMFDNLEIPCGFYKLQCLSVKALLKYKIPYKSVLPSKLAGLVKRHRMTIFKTPDYFSD